MVDGSLSNEYPDEADELIENISRNESHSGSRAKLTQTWEVPAIDDKITHDAKSEPLAKQVSLLMYETS